MELIFVFLDVYFVILSLVYVSQATLAHKTKLFKKRENALPCKHEMCLHLKKKKCLKMCLHLKKRRFSVLWTEKEEIS